jgi:protoporphyrinogen oxidase
LGHGSRQGGGTVLAVFGNFRKVEEMVNGNGRCMTDTTTKFLVLGGGISGLTAAKALQGKEQEYLLLERCPTLGGLTRTVEVGEFCFDYTGHFLHLCRYETPADIPGAGLRNEAWQQVKRKSFCYVAGKMITAPIQYNLRELPADRLSTCIQSYEARPGLPQTGNPTFRDYIISGFGQYLADIFLIPQNEKTMATSLDRLSIKAVKRFFPPPDEKLVRAGMRTDSQTPEQYNSRFWYPKTGGIGLLVQGLSNGLKNKCVNQEVVAIDCDKRTLCTRDGDRFTWEILLSSIPLKELCLAINDRELINAAAALTHSATISFNIGLRGPLIPHLQDTHWVYVSDRSIPFYRVGFYSNIGHGTCAVGYSSMYVEVGVPGEDVEKIDIVHDLQPKVLKALEDLGWLRSQDIVCTAIHVMGCAYVHHTPERERIMDGILSRLNSCGIFPIGRYGLWDYTSMEDSIESALSAVSQHC